MDLLHRVGGEGDPQRVPDAVRQQRPKGGGGFDQPHPGGPRLGDPQVEGAVQPLRRQAVGPYRGKNIGGLDGHHHVVKVQLLQQADVEEGAFRQGLRRGALVLFQHLPFQAAGVDPDADGQVFFPAGGHHLAHLLLVPNVAGVDADLVRPGVDRFDGQPVVELDIRHQGQLGTRLLDGGDEFRSPLLGHRHPVDLTPGLAEGLGLADVGLDIVQGGAEHRLDGDRAAAANGHRADLNFFRCLTSHDVLPRCINSGAILPPASSRR